MSHFVRNFWTNSIEPDVQFRRLARVGRVLPITILLAVISNRKLLKSLKIDLLHLDLFSSDEFKNKLDRAMPSITNVEEMTIGISFSNRLPFESTRLPRGIAHMLGSMRQLRLLDLKWDSTGMSTYKIKWESHFFELHWPCLEDLRLDNICARDCYFLSAFISNHSSTLKRLSLVNCLTCHSLKTAEEDSLSSDYWSAKRLLEHLQDTMTLESFHLWMYCPFSNEMHWESQIDATNVPNEVQEMDPHRRLLKLIALFVLGQHHWPVKETLIPRHSDRPVEFCS